MDDHQKGKEYVLVVVSNSSITSHRYPTSQVVDFTTNMLFDVLVCFVLDFGSTCDRYD